MPIRTLLTFVVVAVLSTGCGRRGPLEMPPTPDPSAVAAQPTPSAEVNQAEPGSPGSAAITEPQSPRVGNFPDQESAGSQEPAEAVGEAPKRRFFLDALL